ncbi:MAG: sugar O-acetyltransferase, partial [Bacteroidaceae bacterium]|nr:sugar O-acetyltransferase [Bacteroidaceae bacterium]
MTEEQKMKAGLVYDAADAELVAHIVDCHDRLFDYNRLRPSDIEARTRTIKEILGATGEVVTINQPFRCDYGKHIRVGERFFANFNLTILDEAEVTFGDDCFVGPNVGIYTACHDIDPVERNSRREWAEPVHIGHNVWIGGGVTILPGVTIGNNVTIGAGSVVVHDLPDNVVAVGNPARVV